MNNERMLLNSDDSELLVAFETGKTVEKTAKILGKDPSGVSRQLLRISKAFTRRTHNRFRSQSQNE